MTLTFLLVLHLEGCGLKLLLSPCHQEGKAYLRMAPVEEAKPINVAKGWGLTDMI